MSTVRTNAAAAMLGVSPNTLRSWESRFGHPRPRRTEGGHRIFELAEIEALRQAFAETGDISSAISLARERGAGPSTPQRLAHALAQYSEPGSDQVLEESLVVRSLERTVESVLLGAVEALADGSPERSFAWRYATGWLAAAKRVAPPASRRESVLIFDAGVAGSLDALRVQALELMLRRLGLRTLCLPVSLDERRLGGALRALSPDVVLLAGRGAPLPALGALVYCVRQVCGQIEVYDFLGALPESGASVVVQRLGESPLAAAEALRERLDRGVRATAALGPAVSARAARG